MAPKTKVGPQAKLYRPIPSAGWNPAAPPPEASGTPVTSRNSAAAGFSSATAVVSFSAAVVAGQNTPVRNSFASLQDHPSISAPTEHHQLQAAIPAVVVQEDDQNSDSVEESVEENAEDNGSVSSYDSSADESENAGENVGDDGTQSGSEDCNDTDCDGSDDCDAESGSDCNAENDNVAAKFSANKGSVAERPNAAAIATGSAAAGSSLRPTDAAIAGGNSELRRSASEPSFVVGSDEFLTDSEGDDGAVHAAEDGVVPAAEVGAVRSQISVANSGVPQPTVGAVAAYAGAVAVGVGSVAAGVAVQTTAEHLAAAQTTAEHVAAAVLNAAEHDVVPNSAVDVAAVDNDGKLDYVPVSIEDGKLLIAPCDDDISHCKKNWHECLVGYFVGSTLPDSVVKECARRMWRKKGLVDTFVKGRGFYFFRFNSENARKKVLETGPHFMLKHNIVLQQYEKKMRLVKERQTQIAIWVKLFNIPVELLSYRGLSLVASAVGRPLYLDEATKKMVTSSVDRFTFARVCVMADAERALPNEMFVDYGDGDEHIKIDAKYEWRPPHCAKCKVFGHSCDKRAVEKIVTGSYADAVAAPSAAQVQEWPDLATSQQQQNQRSQALPQANSRSSVQLQQQENAGQQQLTSEQQQLAQKSVPQKSAAEQGNPQQQPDASSSGQQQSAAQILASGLQKQFAAQKSTPQKSATPQKAGNPQKIMPATGNSQQRQGPQASQRAIDSQIDAEGWQLPKRKGRGRGRGGGNATQREAPTTRSRSRARVA